MAMWHAHLLLCNSIQCAISTPACRAATRASPAPTATTYYFHGKKDWDFCILSDAGLHINAQFIGKRNPAMSRDFTWIQALGIRFAHHYLYVGAARTARWDAAADHLALAFDDEDVALPAAAGACWSPPTTPALSVTRTAHANTVVVELKGVFRIMANVVPITAEDSRVHGYGVTDDDSLAHLDLWFKFYDLTDDVHGVLGQTYRHYRRWHFAYTLPSADLRHSAKSIHFAECFSQGLGKRPSSFLPPSRPFF
jgi:hypothetical protein